MDQRYFARAFLKKPVFVIGVGVPIRAKRPENTHQTEKEWIVKKYRRFFQHPSVKMIHARDPQSANWITEKLHPKIDVIEAPDIVCALTLPEAHKPDGAPILNIITRQRPKKEDDYSHLNALAQQQIDQGWRIRHVILGTGQVGERDIRNADGITVEKEVIYSEDLQQLSRAIGEATAQVSMKFHGTVVATMYGVPSTVLIPTNKNRNFMRRIDREELMAKFDQASLPERFMQGPPAPIDPQSVAMLRGRAQEVMLTLRESLTEHTQSSPRHRMRWKLASLVGMRR